ncbi:16S rRNA (adenine(1518)-N(6)/adenine(1519)-N(6))-dimethyltransferase RsmA [Chloroflexota bacterium]
MAESLLNQTRRLLHRFDLKTRKSLAQHLLVDEEALELSLEAAELTLSDIVLEVGPGLGVLTRELAKRAGRVVAIELDDKLAALLKQALASCSNVVVINEDILKIDPEALLREQTPNLPQTITSPSRYKVVANLPYYITSAVLRHFLEAPVKPQMMVVMVQKEVAQAIVAEPGRMSVLSISVQLYGKPGIIGYVPAASFYPAPEVDSAILRIDLYPEPAVAVDEKSFFKLVRAGFTASRKQIGNSLAQGLGVSKAEVLPLLEKTNIEAKRRAETLTLDEWARLWRAYIGESEHADNSSASQDKPDS